MRENFLRWEICSKTSAYARAVESAKKIIEEALLNHTCCISWSSGKDSTAMTHLVRSFDASIPVIIQFDDCDWPSKKEYVQRVAATHNWKYHVVEPDFSVWKAALESGIGNVNICAQTHWITKESFLRPLREKQQELGCDCVFLGLRANESRIRKINVATRGTLYQLKNGMWHALPMARWAAEDVFAYMYVNGIEINPCYLQNRITAPENIRLSWAIPTPTSISKDGIEHLRLYYPSQYRRLRDANIF